MEVADFVQSEKTRKYDRQLRLWGEKGQEAIDKSHICLVGSSLQHLGSCGVLGTEVMRPLALAGCNRMTVVEPNQPVTERDTVNNFFLPPLTIGSMRGEAAMVGLIEMNDDLKAEYVDGKVEDILSGNVGGGPDKFFDKFSIVVTVNLEEKSLVALSKVLWAKELPMVVVKTVGLLGYIRLQFNEVFVTDPHTRDPIPSLQLTHPFPALSKHVLATIHATQTPSEYSKLPYPIVLSDMIGKWCQQHQEYPKTFQEKLKFKDLVKQEMREKYPNDFPENVEQALRAVNTLSGDEVLPSNLKALFEQVDSAPSSAPFFRVVSAMKRFYTQHGRLPVPGTMPDMAANTDTYIALQNVYRTQASEDAAEVYKLCMEDNKTTALEFQGVEPLVTLMCRNVRHLARLAGSCLAEEYTTARPAKTLANEWGDAARCYMLLRSSEATSGEVESIKKNVYDLLESWKFEHEESPLISDALLEEVATYGDSQIHTVCAFMGGCVAQEVIKLIQNQYIPLNNTLIYNAISGTTQSFTL